MKTFLTLALLIMTSGVFAQSISKEVKQKQNLKNLIIGEWKFHEITLRTPKDGYLPHIAAQETNIIKLLIANYVFNKDGSITLDSKYMEKQGVKSAKWVLSEMGKLTITYFWTPEKIEEFKSSENKVEIDYKVNIIPGKKLTLNWNDMFIVNLVRK